MTAAGTLGLAGVQSAIYPTASPGGYQILGRTLSPWSALGKFEGEGNEQCFLIRSFDVIKWVPMGEEEFAKVGGPYIPPGSLLVLTSLYCSGRTRFHRRGVHAEDREVLFIGKDDGRARGVDER